MKEKNIVLLHGWGADTQKYEPLKKELKKCGWKVFVPELPGFGVSDPVYAWDLNDYSKFVLDKSNEFFFGKKFYLFGHSFGGAIALKSANDVDALVLCAPRGITRTNIFKRLLFLLLAKIGKMFVLFPVISNVWKKIIYKLAREHDYEKTRGVMKDVFKNVVNENLRTQVSEVKIPTLILWGSIDKMTPIRGAYYLKSKIKNSKLIVFDDLGHKLPYEKPAELAREIDKWEKAL